MSSAFQSLLIVAVAVVSAGCNPFSTACTEELRHGINVEVRDAVSGAPAAAGARLTIREGDYVETMDGPAVPELVLLFGAGERAGSYTVTVQKAGYQEWTRRNVIVRDGGCHVLSVRLEARLQPVS